MGGYLEHWNNHSSRAGPDAGWRVADVATLAGLGAVPGGWPGACRRDSDCAGVARTDLGSRGSEARLGDDPRRRRRRDLDSAGHRPAEHAPRPASGGRIPAMKRVAVEGLKILGYILVLALIVAVLLIDVWAP